MKTTLFSTIAAALSALALTGCDAMWGTSLDFSPDSYDVGVNLGGPLGGWYNPPLTSPYFGPSWWNGPGYIPSTPPLFRPSRPIIRPPQRPQRPIINNGVNSLPSVPLLPETVIPGGSGGNNGTINNSGGGGSRPVNRPGYRPGAR